MKKRLVVIGANSFSGQDFVDCSLDSGLFERIVGCSRSAERGALFLRYRTRQEILNYEYHQLDLNRDMPKLLTLLDEVQPHYIVNFAAQSEVAPSWEHPEHWFQTNTVSLAMLVNHLRRQRYLERYLHISSPEVYGSCSGVVTEASPVNPSTPYAASKASADLLLSVFRKQFDFPLLTIRATNVYGARQQLFKIIPRSVIYLKLNKPIELHGGGVAVKSYIHIRDVSEGTLAALTQGIVGDMYHLSPDGGISVRDVVTEICGLMDKDFASNTKLVDERPGQDSAYVIDSSKARHALGWKPRISLKEGLRDVVTWVEEYWDEIQKEPLTYQHKA